MITCFTASNTAGNFSAGALQYSIHSISACDDSKDTSQGAVDLMFERLGRCELARITRHEMKNTVGVVDDKLRVLLAPALKLTTDENVPL